MNKEQKKLNYQWVDLLKTIILGIGSVISAIILDFLIGNVIPNFWGSVFIILIVVILLFIIFAFYLFTIISEIKSEDIFNNCNVDCQMCKYDNSLCCGKETFNYIKKDFELIPNDSIKNSLGKKYSLYYDSDILPKIEKDFYKKNGKEVWVVSSNLSTELSGGAVDFVLDNLNNGIVYKEFYALKGFDGNKSITTMYNVDKIKEIYDNNQNLHLLPYDELIKYDNGNVLERFIFEIYGIVIYFYGDYSEMYYSIRKGVKNRPIYFKAPHCMMLNIINVLKNIQSALNNE